MIYKGHTSEILLKNLRENFEKVVQKSESVIAGIKINRKKKISKWISTCRIIENKVPDYLLKRLKEYY